MSHTKQKRSAGQAPSRRYQEELPPPWYTANMKKILVVGSQGFIGTRLTRYLEDYGYSVQGSDIGTFKDCLLTRNYKDCPTVRQDAASITKTELEKFNVVINLASNANDPTSSMNPEKYYEPAEAFSERIAQLCRDLGVQYIFPSSCSVYGSAEGLCTETSTPRPLTPYSESKLRVEKRLSALANESFTPVALRIATVFGYSPRIRFDLVVNMFLGMLLTENRIMLNSNGESWRPHVYIEDVLEAFRCAIEFNASSGVLEIFNVGNDSNNMTILETANLMSGLFPSSTVESLGNEFSHSIFRDRKIVEKRDQRDYKVSFEKIYNELPGFNSKTSLLEGVRGMAKDLKAHNLDSQSFRSTKFYRLNYLEEFSGR